MIRLGRPVSRFLDAAKQVGENRDEIALAHVHQLLDLEASGKLQSVKPVLFGVEQLAHRTIDSIVMQRILDLAHLHAGDKIRKRAPLRLRHQRRFAVEMALRCSG